MTPGRRTTRRSSSDQSPPAWSTQREPRVVADVCPEGHKRSKQGPVWWQISAWRCAGCARSAQSGCRHSSGGPADGHMGPKVVADTCRQGHTRTGDGPKWFQTPGRMPARWAQSTHSGCRHPPGGTPDDHGGPKVVADTCPEAHKRAQKGGHGAPRGSQKAPKTTLRATTNSHSGRPRIATPNRDPK